MKYVIGVDEVGRGCLAGDVYVAAVMVPEDMTRIEGVDDSKKLSPAKRERLHGVLTKTPDLHYRLAHRTAQDIDKRGILKCLQDCFSEVIQGLVDVGLPIMGIRVDGEPVALRVKAPVPVQFIVRGDATDWVVGAASIIAKVERDAYMTKLAETYPGYGWEQNKGYGTPQHQEGMLTLGLTVEHRRTFCHRWATPTPPHEVEDEIDVFSLFKDR